MDSGDGVDQITGPQSGSGSNSSNHDQTVHSKLLAGGSP
jgi:hypothetical protein